jgi:hypothetical protein
MKKRERIPPRLEQVSTPPRPADESFTCARLAIVLLLFLVAAYPEVIRGTYTFYYRDFGNFGAPLAHYLRESLLRGEIPLWNPLSDCGYPFAAQWSTMVFYPGSLLFLVAPIRWSVGFFCFGHLLLAGAGMYLLARRFSGNRIAATFAGLVFATNGLVTHSLMWPHYMAAFGWMPFVVLTAERGVRDGGRFVWVAALIGALQVLTGAPEPIALTWLFVATWTAWLAGRNEVRWSTAALRLAAVGVSVVALSAVQLLPFVHLLRHSDRHFGFGDSLWSMPLWGWANFLVPLYHATPSSNGVFTQDAQQFFSSYYLGIGTVLLAVWALVNRREPRLWALGSIAIVAALLALGDDGYIYAGARKILPILGFIRYPVKWLILVAFVLPLMAAIGFAELIRDGTGMKSLIAVAAILAVLTGALALFAYVNPVANESGIVTLRNGLGRLAFLGGALLLLVWLAGSRSPRTKAYVSALVILLAAADLLTHTPRQHPVVRTVAYEPIRHELADAVQPGDARALVSREMRNFLAYASTPDPVGYYIGLRRAAYQDCNLVDEIPKVDGFLSLHLSDFSRVAALFYNTTADAPEALEDFLGVRAVSSPERLFAWNARPTAMPLLTGGQRPIFAGDQEVLAALASGSFDPHSQVYLPEDARQEISVQAGATVSVQQKSFAAHEWRFDVEASAPAIVVISQAFYDRWRAFVDDRAVPLYRANLAFQAIQVPAGKHAVKLAYVDREFEIGAGVSAASLATILLLIFRSYRQRRKPPGVMERIRPERS